MSAIKRLDDDLLKQLECPVCMEYMQPPIALCENGHSICSDCNSVLQTCPTCRGKFLQARNVALEDIARSATYPCSNREAGCTVVFPMNQKNYHQYKCLFASRECPFAKLSASNCPWTGILSGIGGHVVRDHGADSRVVSGAFTLKLETLCASKRYIEAVFTLGKLFYILWEIKESNVFFAVFHIGPEKDAEEFTYDFKIKRRKEKVSMRVVCHSYLQDKVEVMQPGECVMLPYGAVLKYLSKNSDLTCEIEIRRYGEMPLFSALSKWFDEQTTLPTGAPNAAASSQDAPVPCKVHDPQGGD